MCSNCQSFRIRVRHDITIINIPCMNCGGGINRLKSIFFLPFFFYKIVNGILCSFKLNKLRSFDVKS